MTALLIEGVILSFFTFIVFFMYSRYFKDKEKNEEQKIKSEDELPLHKKVNIRLSQLRKNISETLQRRDLFSESSSFTDQQFPPFFYDYHRDHRWVYNYKTLRDLSTLSRQHDFSSIFPPYMIKEINEVLEKDDSQKNKKWGLKQFKSSLSIFLFHLGLKLKKYFST